MPGNVLDTEDLHRFSRVSKMSKGCTKNTKLGIMVIDIILVTTTEPFENNNSCILVV